MSWTEYYLHALSLVSLVVCKNYAVLVWKINDYRRSTKAIARPHVYIRHRRLGQSLQRLHGATNDQKYAFIYIYIYIFINQMMVATKNKKQRKFN